MRFDTKFLLANLLLILLVILSACSGNGEAESEEKPLAPESSLSEEILLAPQTVQEAYRFAIANPDILKEIPCYCGCGSVGHKNNYQCYVSEIDADGKPVFDSHALG